MLKSFHVVFLGAPRGESHREGSPVMVTVVAILAVLAILVGLLLPMPYGLASAADAQRALATVTALAR
jgi:NADH:ubiquinone oxidoreductase subunit 5 (subunit L)/multisubunit Na+/H+ antiporter MnhA subunit